MNTVVIRVDTEQLNTELLAPAAAVLKSGGLVCFPTETVYGLGADAANSEAVRQIFHVKGRPQDNPLIIHVSSVEEMKTYFSEWDQVAECLTASFCPGPFTLIMKHRLPAGSAVTAGLPTVGVRIPSHPVARSLIQLSGCGIAAPSANISGRPSPTNAADALEDLDGRIPCLVDGGDSLVGLESTIVSWDEGKLEILRPGGVSEEEIRMVLDQNRIQIPLLISYSKDSSQEAPRAPGMKYKHYAPKAAVKIVHGSDAAEKIAYLRKILSEKRIGTYPAFYVSAEVASGIESDLAAANISYEQVVYSEDRSHALAAKGLFAAFRRFDRLGVTAIWAEEQSLSHLGSAYMNRLAKAAGENQ